MKEKEALELQEKYILNLQDTQKHFEKKVLKFKNKRIYKEEKLHLKLEKKCKKIEAKACKKKISLRDENGNKIAVNYKKMYTLGEEIFNAISHGLGAFFSIIAITLILIKALSEANIYKISAGAVYGITLFVLYLMSTLYHAITHRRAKAVFRIFDHCSIFILIAGSYTPYLLVTMRQTFWGPILFLFVWLIAILGIVLNSISITRFRVFSMISYLALGWFILLSIKDLVRLLPMGGIILLFAGGLAYTGGIVFFAITKYKYMHSIWHLFVLLGSILHFISIYIYVL